MRLRDVLQYAIEYASRITRGMAAIAQAIAHVAPLFRSEWLESARIYLTNGVPEPGMRFRNPDLGAPTSESREAERAGAERDRQIEAADGIFTRASWPSRSTAACPFRRSTARGSARRTG